MSQRISDLCRFDRSLTRLAVLSNDNRLKIWDATTGSLLHNWKSETASAFTTLLWAQPPTSEEDPNANSNSAKVFDYVILGTKRGNLLVFDAKRGKLTHTLGEHGEGHTSRVNDTCFLGNTLYSSSNSDVICWNIITGKIDEKITGIQGPRKLSVSSSGILAGGFYGLKLWDLSSKKVIKKLTGHASPVSCLKFSPQAKYLISSSNDRFISIWSASLQDDITAPLRTIVCDNTPLFIDTRPFLSSDTTERFDVSVSCRSGVVNVWHINTAEKPEKPQPPDGSCSSPSSPLTAALFFTSTQLLLLSNPPNPTFTIQNFREENNTIIKQILITPPSKPAKVGKKVKPVNEVKAVSGEPSPFEEEAFKLETALTRPALLFSTRKQKKKSADKEKEKEKEKDDKDDSELTEELLEPSLPSLAQLLSSTSTLSKEDDHIPKADSLKLSLELALNSNDEEELNRLIQTTKADILRVTVATLSPQLLPPLLKHLVQIILSKSSETAFPAVSWLQTLFIFHASFLKSAESAEGLLVCLNQHLLARAPVAQSLNKLAGRIDLAISLTDRNKATQRTVAQTTYTENRHSAPFIGLRDDTLLEEFLSDKPAPPTNSHNDDDQESQEDDELVDMDQS